MAGTLPSTSFAPGAAVALMATTLGGLLRQLSTRIYPACRTGPSGGGRAHMALFRTRYFNHMSRRFALLVLLISVSYQHQWPSHHPVVELSALNMAMLYRRQILPLQLVQEECRSTSTRDTSSHCDGTVAANNKATDDVPSGQSDSGADEHAYDQQLLDMDHEELTLAKQRVALFTASYNHHVDGVALTLNRLVDHLLEQGHKVLVFAPTNGKAPALNASGEIVVAPSIPAPLWHEYQITTGFNEDVLGRLRAFQPTLIHIAIQDVLGWRALLYARRNQLPTVCSYHTRWTNYLGYYTMLPKGLVDFGWWYLRQFHTRCDVTMPPTPVIAQELAAHGISDGVRLWPRGIDVRGFNPKFRSAEWRREIGVLESEVLILTVCRLRWEKGLREFVAVVKQLEAQGLPHRSMVIGDGPILQDLMLELRSTFFLGTVKDRGALAIAYASADIFLFPSSSETWGSTTLEAMASGLPVIGSTGGGTSALVANGTTGFLFDPATQLDAMAAATGALVRDSAARRALGSAAAARARQFSWEHAHGRLLRGYQAALGR